MAWIDIFTQKRKGQQKAKCNLRVHKKRPAFAFKSNVNYHDNHNIAMLFYAWKKLNANLIYCLKNNMQE